MNPLLQIARLRKERSGRELFDIANFALEAEKAYVLTGINGAGKSTLLRVLAGLETAQVSGLVWQGKALALTPYPLRMRDEVVYVHQDPVMFSTSVRDNIGFGLRVRGISKVAIEREVDAAMAWAGVTQLAASDPSMLSGGEKQRVALARARVLHPRLLLLDEPTASLDGEAREQVMALIPELTASGCTLVIACHDRDIIGLHDVQRIKLRDGRLEYK